jgi:predicted enzyme related to lactoylglutathione lyase
MAPSASSPNKLTNLSAYFLVPDVVKAAEYYRDVLGFHFDRFWGDPPCFAMIRRDEVEFMLSQQEGAVGRPNQESAPCCWDAYIRVADVRALYDEFKAKGARSSEGRSAPSMTWKRSKSRIATALLLPSARTRR